VGVELEVGSRACPGKVAPKQVEEKLGKGGGNVTLLKPNGEPIGEDRSPAPG